LVFLFLTNALLLVLAVVLNAGVFGQLPARAPQVALHYQTLAFLALVLAGGLSGLLIYRRTRKPKK
jgi:choline-glycine betaine transporter